ATHAITQDSSTPVTWRWRSRGASIRGLQGTSHRWLAQRSEVGFLLGSPRRAWRPAWATDLSDWLSFLVLPSALRPTTSDTRFRFFTPAPTLLPPERRPPPSRRCP